MGPNYELLVDVLVVSIVMAVCGMGRDLFDFEEASSSYWDDLLNSR